MFVVSWPGNIHLALPVKKRWGFSLSKSNCFCLASGLSSNSINVTALMPG